MSVKVSELALDWNRKSFFTHVLHVYLLSTRLAFFFNLFMRLYIDFTPTQQALFDHVAATWVTACLSGN